MTRHLPACVVSPHHHASAAGAEVLRDGGNAVDAAIAANLMLSVVTPYHCGPGGDLLALVWQRDRIVGYQSIGRAPAAADRDRLVDLLGSEVMPARGPHTVTVPGAVAGWFELLDRYGTSSFGHLVRPAIVRAADGFVPSAEGAAHVAGFATETDDEDWHAIYGEVRAGEPLRQPGLARLLRTLAEQGPDAFYRGPIAEAVVGKVRGTGGVLTAADLAAHAGAWVELLTGTFRDLVVVEHPPPTQGVTALQALAIADGLDLPDDPAGRTHLLVEAMRLALADRAAHLADPDAMRVRPAQLLGPSWIRERRARVTTDDVAAVGHGLAGPGDTAYLCAADADGMLVSLIQSNYRGFGSGLTVPGWGLNLHDRGAAFSLDRSAPSVLAPRRQPPHTLIPAMAVREGRPVLVFGTMGGDGQAQTHLQLLDRLTRGATVDEAIAAPRWFVSPADGTVAVEDRLGEPIIRGLADRGHRVAVLGSHEHLMGHAHAIAITGDGYVAATDPRTEGAVHGEGSG
ncbi:MAG: gamma-glutamyltransferase family protein [Actinobacteria bacterium]|nr:gamma-glutamyltransferase family protein [Actinomycetota bacterium]